MEITLTIQDKVWADFVLFLEDNHRGCNCEANPSRYINARLKEELLRHKWNELCKARLSQITEASWQNKSTEVLHQLVEGMFGPGLQEDTEQMDRWKAEYEE